MPNQPRPEPVKTNGEVDEDHDLTEESEEKQRKTKERKHDSGAADLEKVTDYAEEEEISAADISGVSSLDMKNCSEGLQYLERCSIRHHHRHLRTVKKLSRISSTKELHTIRFTESVNE